MTLKLVRIARLKQLAKDRSIEGPVDLGRAIGRKTNQASDLLQGRASFGEKIARSIEHVAGLPPGWLDDSGMLLETIPGEKPKRGSVAIDLVNNPDYPAIPYVNFKLSAGASGFGVEYDVEASRILVFGKDWYASRHLDPEKLFAVKVCNGSMEPGLYDKDTVVVNTADTMLKDGQVFAMNFEGELVIKRMVRDGGRWWLASDNTDQTRYPRKVCDENVFPVGRIVHKQSERI